MMTGKCVEVAHDGAHIATVLLKMWSESEWRELESEAVDDIGRDESMVLELNDVCVCGLDV